MNSVEIIYLGAYAVMLYSTLLWFLIYYERHKEVSEDPEPKEEPGVTIIVPAYNEEEYIGKCLDCFLKQEYPKQKLHVLVINDGSTDKTGEIAQQYAQRYDHIELINKENSGKGSSLNNALDYVKTPVVGCMDADSYPSKDYIRCMIGYLEDEKVVAVTPALKVKSPKSWVQKIQWPEYVFQVFLRKIFAFFDVQYVVPGPGSLYKTSFLRQCGGFDPESLTEDMEIAFRVYDHKKAIENSVNAEVHTEAPHGLRELFRQRIRWYRGYIHSVIQYRHFLFNKAYGNLGLYLLPLNILWIGLVFFLMAVPIYYTSIGILDYMQTLSLIGFQLPNFAMAFTIFDLSYHNVFMLLLGAMSLGIMLLSLKTANEDIKIKKRYPHYLLFATVYLPLFAGFWLASIIEELRGAYRRW